MIQWTPSSDQATGSCHTVTIGLTYGIASGSVSFDQCSSGNNIAILDHCFRNLWYGDSFTSHVETAAVDTISVTKPATSQFSYHVGATAGDHGCEYTGTK